MIDGNRRGKEEGEQPGAAPRNAAVSKAGLGQEVRKPASGGGRIRACWAVGRPAYVGVCRENARQAPEVDSRNVLPQSLAKGLPFCVSDSQQIC